MDPYLEGPVGWPEVHLLLLSAIHDRYLQVHDARSRSVITAIELLSPANKVKNSRGRRAMLKKREVRRRAQVHWMEVDLLRAGERDPQIAESCDYCVTLWPAGLTKHYAWFIDLRDRLPTVTIPLRDPEEHAPFDLQQALDTMYDRARLAESIDYTAPIPEPPPSPADRAWIEHTLEAWRARQSSA
jgi:hypothetical protein